MVTVGSRIACKKCQAQPCRRRSLYDEAQVSGPALVFRIQRKVQKLATWLVAPAGRAPLAGNRSHLEIAKGLKRLPPALGGSSPTETWHLVSTIDGSLTLPVGLVSGSVDGYPLPLGSSPGPSQRAAGPTPAGVCADTLWLPCAVARNSPGPAGGKVAMTSRHGGSPPPPPQMVGPTRLCGVGTLR